MTMVQKAGHIQLAVGAPAACRAPQRAAITVAQGDTQLLRRCRWRLGTQRGPPGGAAAYLLARLGGGESARRQAVAHSATPRACRRNAESSRRGERGAARRRGVLGMQGKALSVGAGGKCCGRSLSTGIWGWRHGWPAVSPRRTRRKALGCADGARVHGPCTVQLAGPSAGGAGVLVSAAPVEEYWESRQPWMEAAAGGARSMNKNGYYDRGHAQFWRPCARPWPLPQEGNGGHAKRSRRLCGCATTRLLVVRGPEWAQNKALLSTGCKVGAREGAPADARASGQARRSTAGRISGRRTSPSRAPARRRDRAPAAQTAVRLPGPAPHPRARRPTSLSPTRPPRRRAARRATP
jgi:hypothetical protein